MNEKFNVLVCGCGGDIGQSIGKILCESGYVNNLYGCDISEKHASKFIYPTVLRGLPCSDPGYLGYLNGIIEENRIQLVIPVSEAELRFFHAKGITGRIADAALLMASEKALKTGFDKLETASFLQQEGLPFPVTSRISSVDSVDKFPLIVKPLAGSGSRGVHVAGDQETFAYLKGKYPESIVQEYLDGKQGEFTCGLFRSSRGIIRTIIFKRELMGGLSIYGEVIDNEDIEYLLIRIAIGLELTGSINVQLRLTDKGPVVFEINPRFSSTVRFRHLLGFKDVEWAIEDRLNLPLSGYARVSQGKRFYKGFAEYIE